jgi:hypothetical protein
MLSVFKSYPIFHTATRFHRHNIQNVYLHILNVLTEFLICFIIHVCLSVNPARIQLVLYSICTRTAGNCVLILVYISGELQGDTVVFGCVYTCSSFKVGNG